MSPSVASSPTTTSAFFYGTLMHPKILRRVIGHNGNNLEIAPAVLLDFTRHKVKDADYPGILPYARSQATFNLDLGVEDRSVRGTMVTGLTANDIRFLDTFEGDEYIRKEVSVYLLAPSTSIPELDSKTEYAIVPANPPPLPSNLSDLSPSVAVQTYVYGDPKELEAELWSFDSFVKNNAWKWTGEQDDHDLYTDVDKRYEAVAAER
ncbi:hypothetical protein ONZ45_g1429 [Pleurotus djamor]|nr:hypothetical protein ONZ45_g1429 [Pleurotus djamor]